MSWFRWSVPLLGLALAASDASAQNVIVISPYGSGTSLSYTRVGKHNVFSLSTSSYGPYGYGYAYLGPLPRYSYYSSSVTIYTYAPPPLIVAPREPLFSPDDDYLPTPRDPQARRNGDVAPMEKPAPGRDAGDIRPLDRPEKIKPPEPPPVKAPEPPPDDSKLPPLPHPPRPAANPVAESLRLVGLGKTAFADQEYGLAAERFFQASKLTPNDAMPLFLQAQALVALAKYLDAVDAINAGLALQPDWPSKRFQPLELYGQHVAAYPEHLRRLEDTLANHPNDAALLFLSGYELWFDGRKDEARARFRRARPAVPDPALVDRFLQAKPAAPVAAGDTPRNWL